MLESVKQSDSLVASDAKRQVNSEVVPISLDRQKEIQEIEKAYLRRELYDPVEKAYKSEPPQQQEAWKGILQTAEDELYYCGGGILTSWREHVGRGAEEALKQGCRYPVPIGFAYSSLRKRTVLVHDAFVKTFESLENDSRWNAASRMAFYGMMAIKDNAPSNYQAVCEARLTDATYDFLTKKDYREDELGMVFHLARFFGAQVLEEVGKRLESENVELDPWLAIMLKAQRAHNRAWKARGNGFIDTVTAEGAEIFSREIVKVSPLMKEAYNLRPELSQSCALALESSYGDEPLARYWLKRLRASRMDAQPGYSQFLWGIRPRWCGSTQKMTRFLLDLVAEKDFDTLVPIFAYERLVKDVFESEGGVVYEGKKWTAPNDFICNKRTLFEPYFEGYRQSSIASKLSIVEKAHLFVALSDLAWRLDKGSELLYWHGKLLETGFPAHETGFSSGYEQYHPYLAKVETLSSEEQRTYIHGLYALYKDGNAKAIDAMLVNAEKLGAEELISRAALGRVGKADILPLLNNPGKNKLGLEFGGLQRDHMVLRFQLKQGSNPLSTHFDFKFFATDEEVGEVSGYEELNLSTRPGMTGPGTLIWDYENPICTFELEIVGQKARLTKGELRIWEKTLPYPPSYCREFCMYYSVNGGCQLEKCELEVREDKDFSINSSLNPRPKDTQGPLLGGVYPCEIWGAGRRYKHFESFKDSGNVYGDYENNLFLDNGDNLYTYMSVSLPMADEEGFTAIAKCRTFDKNKLEKPEVVLGAFSLNERPNRILVVADVTSGEVYAIDPAGERRWKGEGKIDFSSSQNVFSFGYSERTGLVVYYRKQDGIWRPLIICPECHFENEKPTHFWFCSFNRKESPNLPFHNLNRLMLRRIYTYPKVLTLDELKDFP